MPRRRGNSEEHNCPSKRRRCNQTEPVLTVDCVDYRRNKNRNDHCTDQFQEAWNIFRRGQAFKICITFNRKIDQSDDGVIFQFEYGSRLKQSKGITIHIPVAFDDTSEGQEDQTKPWRVYSKIVSSGNQLECSFTSSPNCSVGRYEFFIETTYGECKSTKRHKGERIIILFNPWKRGDAVYMKKEDERQEYVLNETGYIWTGSMLDKIGKPWDFGQFDCSVLDVVLKLLQESKSSEVEYSSPVSIVRYLSAKVNAMDDKGVLVGRWNEPFPKNSTHPMEWTGSVPIFTKYLETGKSVRYGQCWVFSGIMTSLCRCLGIPTRCVTNYESAHDADGSMTFDFHMNEKQEPLNDKNEQIWDFHVWNESWFRRLDLPKGYNGWQAHDGTPQERSGGLMRCGPAPVIAIKKGHVCLNYDVGFMFAEVNGDEVHWLVKDDKTMEAVQKYTSTVGKFISTKRVGTDDREDITRQYKYAEGGYKERQVVQLVNRLSTNSQKQNIYEIKTHKQLQLTVIPPSALIGEDLEVAVEVSSVSRHLKPIHFDLTITLVVADYKGVCGQRVRSDSFRGIIDKEKKKILSITVNADDYRDKMNPEGRFECFIYGTNADTKRIHAKKQSFLLKKPQLEINAPEMVPAWSETNISVTFKNTTSLTLENAVIEVSASGLMKPINRKRQRIASKETITESISLSSSRPSNKTKNVIATFTSDQIVGIHKSAKIIVVKQ